MTIQQILDRSDYILREDFDFNFASTQGAPSTAEQVTLYNEANRTIAQQTRCLFDPRITLNLGEGAYAYSLRGNTLGRKVDKVYRVEINGNYLKTADGLDYGLWTYADVVMGRPGWASAANGTPTAAWQVSDVLYLNPAPDATIAATTGYVEATYLPVAKGTGDVSEEGQLPEELHPAVAIEMALSVAEPSMTEAHQMRRWELLSARKNAICAPYRERMDNHLSALGSTGATSPSDTMFIL